MAGKHRRASSLGTTRMTAGVLTALTMASTCISTANAVPKVVSQPGTQDAQEQPPIQQAPSQTVQSTPIHRVEAVRSIYSRCSAGCTTSGCKECDYQESCV